MAKVDTVNAQIAAVQAGQLQALTDGLGVCYDQGALDQKASDGTLTQADLDKAVADAKAADAVILAQAQADGQAALAVVQQQLTDMTSKEKVEEGVISGLQTAVTQAQAALAAIAALFPVPPTPPPPVA